MTHAYFASEVFTFAPLIPAGILALIRKYRQDFLYGNLMADMIIGKKYLPDAKSSHSWDVGFRLMEQAENGSEQAFVYGFLCHLAADTVAHNSLTEEALNIEHAWLEMKADSIINKSYWFQSVTISRAVQRRNDLFMEDSLDRYMFSFKTNKRIFKGIVFLSFLNKKRKRTIDKDLMKKLHHESMSSIIDLLRNGKKSRVLKKRPL
ncbi:MAG: zinc dependent phospholipase C family protein [Nitrospirae bacterium]|nr:zinc dependent phospholipase C family protein [Nitrospirota bacterium]